MPLKKKDRDRLFEKDLEKGENSTVAPFRTLMTDSIFTAPFYRIFSMHTGSPAGSGPYFKFFIFATAYPDPFLERELRCSGSRQF
jgi:hypothetical protein